MAFGSVVQTKTGSSGEATSITLTFDQTATSGNLLVMCEMNGHGSTVAPSGWTVVESVFGTEMHSIYFKESAGTETAVNSTQSGFGTMAAVFYEIEGPLLDGLIDVEDNTSYATSQTSTSAGTTGTTTTADSIAVASIGQHGTSNDTTGTWDNGFGNTLNSGNSSDSIRAAIKILTATGTVTTSLNSHVSSGTTGIIVVFEGDPAAGTSIPIFMHHYRNNIG